MARPRSEIPFEKQTLNLGKGDFAAMGQLFPAIGAGVAIRLLVHNFVKQVRAKTAPLDIEIPNETLKELLADDRDTSGTSGN